MSANLRTVAVVLIDVALLGVCAVHLPSVLQRPTVPFIVSSDAAGVLVKNISDAHLSGGLAPNDRIVAWKDQRVRIPEALEFLADLEVIGGHVPVTYVRHGVEAHATVTLVPFYPTPRFVVIMFFVGFVTWIVAVVIAWNAGSNLPARVLHWTLISMAVTLLLTYGAISPSSLTSHVVRLVFALSYPAMAVLFFVFTMLYPMPKLKPGGIASVAIAAPLAVLVPSLWYTGTRAMLERSAEWFELHQGWFDMLHLSLLVYTAGSFIAVGHSIRHAATDEERKRLAWIIAGVAIGVSPFLVLQVLPQLVGSTYLIAEEYAAVFLLAIPFCFAISLLRYRLLEVQLLVRRVALHAALTGLLGVIFALVVLLAVSVLFGSEVFGEYFLPVTITLIVALLFNPLRRRVQHIVDETLFAARVRFRRSIAEIGSNLQQSLSSDQLFERLVRGLTDLIPAEVLAVYRRAQGGSSLELAASSLPGAPATLALKESHLEALAGQEVFGLKGSLDGSRKHREELRIEFLEGTDFAVCVPIVSDAHVVLGVILVMPRGGTDRLQEEEIDLVASVAREAGEVLGRLELQAQIILEGEERRRLQELSSLKSDFVSYVSHELRTPLTSIGMFSEFLRDRLPRRDRKSREYLHIIQGEAGRLARMVSTILNAAKFDSEGTIFRRERADLGELVSVALESMRYQLEQHKFTIVLSLPKRELPIQADRESVVLALTNVIGNAIKYSPSRRFLSLRVRRLNAWARCEVRDRGMGIAAEAMTHIFEKFYRAPTLAPHSKGVGLGLPLVRQVMEGHGGRIEVKSELGQGSTFTLWFPLEIPQKQ